MSKERLIGYFSIFLILFFISSVISMLIPNDRYRYHLETAGGVGMILDEKTGAVRFCNAKRCVSPKDEYPEWDGVPIGSGDEIDFNDKGAQ